MAQVTMSAFTCTYGPWGTGVPYLFFFFFFFTMFVCACLVSPHWDEHGFPTPARGAGHTYNRVGRADTQETPRRTAWL